MMSFLSRKTQASEKGYENIIKMQVKWNLMKVTESNILYRNQMAESPALLSLFQQWKPTWFCVKYFSGIISNPCFLAETCQEISASPLLFYHNLLNLMQCTTLLYSQSSCFRKLWAGQETVENANITQRRMKRVEITSILPHRFITLSKCSAEKIIQNFHPSRHDL